jgi:hypothetical protein
MFGGRLAESNSNRASDPSVFKTVPGPAQLTFHYLVEIQGLEPRMPWASDLQSDAVTCSAQSPSLAHPTGFEPVSPP